MARICQADDTLERQFEALLKQQAGPEVGLLVGKHAAGAKALLFGTVRTPSQEGLDPILVAGAGPPGRACSSSKAGKKPPGAGGRPGAGTPLGGVAVTLEAEWIAEHARQVARMLPGGLSVLGLYVFCPDAAYTAAAPQLCSLLASLAAFCLTGAGPVAASDAPGEPQPHHLLLLHVDASSKKQAMRALPVCAAAASAAAAAAVPSALRPVELKFAATLGSLVLLRCWHGVDLDVPVVAGGSAQMRRQLAALVAAEGERIRHGVVATAGGAVPPESAPISEALATDAPVQPGSAASAPTGGPLHVPTFDMTLLAPPRCQLLMAPETTQWPAPQHGEQQQPSGAGSQVVDVVGQARLRGCLQGLAFVSKRDSAGRAVADLKADLVASLSARIELLVEEAARVAEAQQLQQEEDKGGQAAGGPPPPMHPLMSSPAQLAGSGVGGCEVALPRRVLMPWLGGGLALCDYLLEGEPVEAAAERAAELLALQGSSQVLECELPPDPTAAGPWQPNALPGSDVPTGKGATKVDHAGGSGGTATGLPCSGTVLASLAVAALASALGLLSLWGTAGGKGQV